MLGLGLVCAASGAQADVIRRGLIVSLEAQEAFFLVEPGSGIAVDQAVRIQHPIRLKHPVSGEWVDDELPVGEARVTMVGSQLAMVRLSKPLRAEVLMGDDLAVGQRPQVVVPAGVWQGSSTCGEWTLLGTTMTPPYTDEGFELGRRDELLADWPPAAGRIAELTRG